MVFGPMEHVLWDATLTRRPIDIDATAAQLIDVLWAALAPPDLALDALQRFRVEVADASRRFDEARAAANGRAGAGIGTKARSGVRPAAARRSKSG